jgi:fumarate hydratase class I
VPGGIIKRYGVRRHRQGWHGRQDAGGTQGSGAVYLNAIGGAAQFYARCIQRVDGVSLMEFGTPEAMWHLDVRDFPAIVTMDAHGSSLHKDVEEASGKILETLA